MRRRASIVLTSCAVLALWTAAPAVGDRPGAPGRVCAQPEGVETTAAGERRYEFSLRSRRITMDSRAAPCLLPNVSFAQDDSFNYSGYEAAAPTLSPGFDNVSSILRAPAYDDAACENDAFGDWVGITGPEGTGTIVQAGLAIINDEGTVAHGAFAEIVGGPLETGGPMFMSDVTYVPGHNYAMGVSIFEEFGTIQFVVQDQNDPDNAGLMQLGGDVTPYRKPAAFATSERPKLDPDGSDPRPARLTSYMKADAHAFGGSRAYVGDRGYLFSELSLTEWRMVSMSDFDEVLADPTPLQAPGAFFDVNWLRCGRPE